MALQKMKSKNNKIYVTLTATHLDPEGDYAIGTFIAGPKFPQKPKKSKKDKQK